MSFIRTSPTAEALIDVGVVGDFPIVINVGPGAEETSISLGFNSLAVLLGAAAPQTAATSAVRVALAVAAEVEVEIFEDVGGLRWFYVAATTVRSSVVTQWKLSCWESWIGYVYKDLCMVIQLCKGREMLNS